MPRPEVINKQKVACKNVSVYLHLCNFATLTRRERRQVDEMPLDHPKEKLDTSI